jgi:hypothetical protein
MTSLTLLGIALNFVSAIVLIVPLLFVYSDGGFKRKTRERIMDIAATKWDGNKAVAEELFLSRTCGFLALTLLISGTTLVMWSSL